MTSGIGEPSDDLNVFFIQALSAALGAIRISDAKAERLAGLPTGTLGLWLRNKRTPTAPRFIEACVNMGLDARAVIDDAMSRAERAGALKRIERLPQDELARLRAEKARVADQVAAADERGEIPGAALHDPGTIEQ